MGDTLGGRPSDRSCYKINGKVDYAIVRQKDFFKKGIERIRMAYEKDLRVVLLCSESRPEQCHRSKLIGSGLHQEKILVQHIDENGGPQDQTGTTRRRPLFPAQPQRGPKKTPRSTKL